MILLTLRGPLLTYTNDPPCCTCGGASILEPPGTVYDLSCSACPNRCAMDTVDVDSELVLSVVAPPVGGGDDRVGCGDGSLINGSGCVGDNRDMCGGDSNSGSDGGIDDRLSPFGAVGENRASCGDRSYGVGCTCSCVGDDRVQFDKRLQTGDSRGVGEDRVTISCGAKTSSVCEGHRDTMADVDCRHSVIGKSDTAGV